MCVRVYVYICVRVRKCMLVYVYMCSCVRACVNARMCVSMCVRVSVSVHICVCVCVRVCAYECVRIGMHVCDVHVLLVEDTLAKPRVVSSATRVPP